MARVAERRGPRTSRASRDHRTCSACRRLGMGESLAYPLCLLAMWAMLRAVDRPSMTNDAILLSAIGLASLARLQLVVLVPTALTAFLLMALARPEAGDGRLRAVWRSV